MKPVYHLNIRVPAVDQHLFQIGTVNMTLSARGLPKYSCAIQHHGLNQYVMMKAPDRDELVGKIEAQLMQWHEHWQMKKSADLKRNIQERKRQYQEECRLMAEDDTREAQAELHGLQNTLNHTLDIDDTVDWERMMATGFEVPEPAPPQFPEEPVRAEEPRRPDPEDEIYQVDKGVMDRILSPVIKKKEREARERYEHDLEAWDDTVAEIDAVYDRELTAYEEEVNRLQAEYDQAVTNWNARKQQFVEGVVVRKEQYFKGNRDSLLDYCDLVLTNSKYPGYFPQDYDIDYEDESHTIIVDYLLPDQADVPALRRVKYDVAHDEFVDDFLSEPEHNALYDELLYQICIRSIHELFEADSIKAIDQIAFNGMVRFTNRATGNDETVCVMSTKVGKEEFLRINLANVEPRLCFENLRGVGADFHKRQPVELQKTMRKSNRRIVPTS